MNNSIKIQTVYLWVYLKIQQRQDLQYDQQGLFESVKNSLTKYMTIIKFHSSFQFIEQLGCNLRINNKPISVIVKTISLILWMTNGEQKKKI